MSGYSVGSTRPSARGGSPGAARPSASGSAGRRGRPRYARGRRRGPRSGPARPAARWGSRRGRRSRAGPAGSRRSTRRSGGSSLKPTSLPPDGAGHEVGCRPPRMRRWPARPGSAAGRLPLRAEDPGVDGGPGARHVDQGHRRVRRRSLEGQRRLGGRAAHAAVAGLVVPVGREGMPPRAARHRRCGGCPPGRVRVAEGDDQEVADLRRDVDAVACARRSHLEGRERSCALRRGSTVRAQPRRRQGRHGVVAVRTAARRAIVQRNGLRASRRRPGAPGSRGSAGTTTGLRRSGARWAGRRGCPRRLGPGGLRADSAPAVGTPPSPSMKPSPLASFDCGTIDHAATAAARSPCAARRPAGGHDRAPSARRDASRTTRRAARTRRRIPPAYVAGPRG